MVNFFIVNCRKAASQLFIQKTLLEERQFLKRKRLGLYVFLDVP